MKDVIISLYNFPLRRIGQLSDTQNVFGNEISTQNVFRSECNKRTDDFIFYLYYTVKLFCQKICRASRTIYASIETAFILWLQTSIYVIFHFIKYSVVFVDSTFKRKKIMRSCRFYRLPLAVINWFYSAIKGHFLWQLNWSAFLICCFLFVW